MFAASPVSPRSELAMFRLRHPVQAACRPFAASKSHHSIRGRGSGAKARVVSPSAALNRKCPAQTGLQGASRCGCGKRNCFCSCFGLTLSAPLEGREDLSWPSGHFTFEQKRLYDFSSYGSSACTKCRGAKGQQSLASPAGAAGASGS